MVFQNALVNVIQAVYYENSLLKMDRKLNCIFFLVAEYFKLSKTDE